MSDFHPQGRKIYLFEAGKPAKQRPVKVSDDPPADQETVDSGVRLLQTCILLPKTAVGRKATLYGYFHNVADAK